jgi:hypothetical protein
MPPAANTRGLAVLPEPFALSGDTIDSVALVPAACRPGAGVGFGAASGRPARPRPHMSARLTASALPPAGSHDNQAPRW